MKSDAQLFVFVRAYDLTPYPEADVSIRAPETRRWGQVPYDDALKRFVREGLEPGEYELRIRGREGWTEDVRTVELRAGNNLVYSTLAPEGTPYYLAADGERVYFQPDEGKLLLYVQGKDLHRIALEMLEEDRIRLGDAIVPPGQKAPPDEAIFMISLPEAGPEREEFTTSLNRLAEERLPSAGLTGRLAVPMFRGEAVVEGLTNELIVQFEPEVSEQEAQEIAKRHGFTVLRPIVYLGNAYLWQHADLPSYGLLEVARELVDRFPVRYAEPNVLSQVERYAYSPNDFLYPEQPHFQVIRAGDAWETLDDIHVNLRAGSPDITLAVFDLDGVDPTHPDLTEDLTDGTAKMSANFDFLNGAIQTYANLQGDHGTQCASSATGSFDSTVGATGLAGNCHLIGAQFPSFTLDTDKADMWMWAAGFNPRPNDPNFPPQLAKGADVLSNSWGPIWPKSPSQVLRGAFDFLTSHGRGGRGCIVCFATGNYGYILVDNYNPYAADAETLAIGASINSSPTNPCSSAQPDHNGNTNNLPAVVDTRSYYSPYGLTIDLVSPSHTCYDPALPPAGILDPVMAAVRVGEGDWPGDAVGQTTLTQAAATGDLVVQVADSAGFNVGEFALFSGPGTTPNETKEITAVSPGQITILALENAYPVGTIVASGPSDYAMNPVVGFGGTSHSCPTVAGAAALLLSIQPELSWMQVREILRRTAERIDPNQANPIGQWVDNDGDGVTEFSEWYGYGRLDVARAVEAARNHRPVALRAHNGQYVCAEGGGGQELVADRSRLHTWETFQLVDLGGDNVALRAHNAQFVCAEGGGGGELVANRDWTREWETFSLVDQGGNKVALRAHNGQYVCAEGGGGQEVVANRDQIGPWETFQLIDLRPQHIVALRAHNGQYVCAEGGGGHELVANRDRMDRWERFDLVSLGDDKVALCSHHGQFACAEDGGGREVMVNRDWIGDWETFELCDLGNGDIALRAQNGQYVCAEGGGGREVVANRDRRRAWELFRLIDLRPACTAALRVHNGQYLCAEGGGGDELVANRDRIDRWETFEFVDLADDKVALRAYNGQYVVAEGGGGDKVIVDRHWIGTWEAFEYIDLGNGDIALRADNTQFVCAEGGGGGEVVANRDLRREWETFKVINLRPGRRIALQAHNGQYVCAEGGGGREVVANRDWKRAWETFELVDLRNDKVALRAHNGQYVCAEGGGGAELMANRNWIAGWESFELVDLGGGKVALRAHNGQYVCAEGGGGGEVLANRDAIDNWATFGLVEV